MANQSNTEPKVRTKVKVRRGGDVVKTKTLTKGDGMKKVEKTKIKKGPMGTSESKMVAEKGPMGKSVKSSFMYKGGQDSYGTSYEKVKKAGQKVMRSSDYMTSNVPSESYQLTKGRKVNIPAYTSTDKYSSLKVKGPKGVSKTKKVTTGMDYDVYGNKYPSTTSVKTKKR